MRGFRTLLLTAVALPIVGQPKWEPDLVISPAGASYTLKATAVSAKDQSVWILAARIIGSSELADLWRIDSSGQNRQTISFPAPPKLERFENVIGTQPDGSIFLLGWTQGHIQLVKIDSTGRTSWVRPLGLDYAHPLGLVAAPQGGLLMFGDGASGAFAARIDETGRRLWIAQIDKHPLASIFLSGMALEDDSCILVGNAWDIKQGNIGMGLGDTLLVKLDARGVIVRQKSFPGRVATATRTSEGKIITIDDPQSYAGTARLGMAAFQDGQAYQNSYMRLQAWTPDLALAWAGKLPEFHVQFLPMSIAPTRVGGVILLGTNRGFQLISSEYDAGGHPVWTVADPERRWAVSSLANRGDAFAVAHQVYEADIRVGLSQFTLR
jgi:hypothetical protein